MRNLPLPTRRPGSLAMICALAGLLLGADGCQYEYDVVEPTQFAGHIGTRADYVVKRDPLEYRLITYESRLVLQAVNPTDDPISLLGDRSTLVDPHDQSHPLRSQTIAPHSFIKLILPPMRPQPQPYGPTIGFGVTAGAGYNGRPTNYRTGYGPTPPMAGPQYDSVVDDNALYWDWDGQTTVQLTLVFERSGHVFSDVFVFKRAKV